MTCPVAVRSLLVVLFAAGVVESQHCGGPCEVPRGDDPVSPNPKYTLSEGIETGNWRYLFNWLWTEDGVQKHPLESVFSAPPLRDFGYRRMFVSPAGNGFLVTGNPYARDRELNGREPPLFVFCDPEGNRLSEIPLHRALNRADERVLGPCPSCDCLDLMYVFAQDPRVSDNGCFVELLARGSNRRIGFFLPLGCVVRNRAEFEAALEAAEWSSISPQQAEGVKEEIKILLSELGSDELGIRTRAAEALVARGFLARTAIRDARAQSTSGDFRARAKAVEVRLRPLGAAGWEAISVDLGLLGSLLSYPDKDVVDSVQSRLRRILPASVDLNGNALAEWIAAHRKDLEWNEAKGQYEMRLPQDVPAGIDGISGRGAAQLAAAADGPQTARR